MRSAWSSTHLPFYGISRSVPFNCLGGHRSSAYKSVSWREFQSAKYCPRPLNPAPPPLPGPDRACNCSRCRDWVVREGRRIHRRPLMGTSFGLRPRKIVEEAIRDGVHWYLLTYWDCNNLDWVPAYLRDTIEGWPQDPQDPQNPPEDILLSLNHRRFPSHWFWILLDCLVHYRILT